MHSLTCADVFPHLNLFFHGKNQGYAELGSWNLGWIIGVKWARTLKLDYFIYLAI